MTLATAASAALQPKSSLLPEWLDPQVFLADPAIGPWVVLLVCGIVFVETGLLIGFFLPGDSLLFTAGLLVATGAVQINIWVLILLIALSAFAGDQMGYLIGRKAGPVVFNRPESRFFHQENVDRAEAFFARHGGKAVVLARFVPVIRTFTPVVAGVGRMHYATFIAYNAIGGAVWALSVTLLGYILGDRVPFVRDNLDLIFLGVIGLTLVFVLAGLFRPGRRKQRTAKQDGAAKQKNVEQKNVQQKDVRKPLPRPRPEAAAGED
ncbi:DedA family protein [Arthrobacter gandavensis]|uniref:DedA family protein n=1 Tax=Arthrobacter gandavensis TaxID=169960 RepID=UPI002B27199F|nr:VTT domain-containing protein [Arthrobacter gandavensis]